MKYIYIYIKFKFGDVLSKVTDNMPSACLEASHHYGG